MDGSSAWAEIDAILASIDPNRASWIARFESSADRQEMSDSGLLDFLVSLEDWAALNQLEEMLPALLAHGFDSASFINGVLSDSDLLELGVRSAAQRRRVLAAVQELPRGVLAVAESLICGATVDWLIQRLRLGRQLGREFAERGTLAGAQLTVDELACVTDDELRQRFNVRKLGHRRRILCCFDNAPALLPIRMAQQQQEPALVAAAAAAAAVKVVQNGGLHRRQSSILSARSSLSSSTKSTSTAAAVAPAPLATSITMATNNSASPAFDSAASDESSSGGGGGGGGGDGSGGGCGGGGDSAFSRPAVTPRLGRVGAAAGAALTEVLPRREFLPGVSRSWVTSRCGGGGVGGGGASVGHGTEDEADGDSGPPAAAAQAAAHTKAAGRHLPLALPRSRSTDYLAGGGGNFDDASLQAATFRPLMRAGWPHHPDVLLRDSFSYSVSYLGFRPLVDHTDLTEILQIMQTFRCKSADILKLPRIRLTVCYRGVKFINPDNDMVITEHRITEIYFASQDNTRLANFAYVTKDSVNSVHYCHCFASHSPETAVLIIQTLSEACGLANQLIEFNQLRHSRQRRHHVRRKRSRRT